MPTDMLIKQMPDELKARIADMARRHHRSMNKEAIALLEAACSPGSNRKTAGGLEVDALLARFRALPDLDRRTANEILEYDGSGLPT